MALNVESFQEFMRKKFERGTERATTTFLIKNPCFYPPLLAGYLHKGLAIRLDQLPSD